MAAPAPAPDMRVGAGESGHGLTTWQKVGIALGVVAIVTGIIICLVVWIRCNRKRRQQQPVAFEFAAPHATAAAAATAPPPPPPSSPASSRGDSGDMELAAPRATAAAAATTAPPPPPPSSPSASSDSGDSGGSVVVHSGAASPLNLGDAATRLLNLDFESSTSSGDASPTTVLDDLDPDSDSSGSNDEFLPVVIVPR